MGLEKGHVLSIKRFLSIIQAAIKQTSTEINQKCFSDTGNISLERWCQVERGQEAFVCRGDVAAALVKGGIIPRHCFPPSTATVLDDGALDGQPQLHSTFQPRFVHTLQRGWHRCESENTCKSPWTHLLQSSASHLQFHWQCLLYPTLLESAKAKIKHWDLGGI